MGKLVKSVLLLSLLGGMSAPVAAQSGENSGTILLQSMPSDDPLYRRMVIVNYQNGVSYKAYTRREFKRADNPEAQNLMSQCVAGNAITIRQLRAFEKADKKLARNNQAPVPTTFCIKNVSNWVHKNKDIFLDPIFNGMPYVSKRIR